ncbi:hypothetical protein COBT_002146, partial [Conglomerata obtusa]
MNARDDVTYTLKNYSYMLPSKNNIYFSDKNHSKNNNKYLRIFPNERKKVFTIKVLRHLKKRTLKHGRYHKNIDLLLMLAKIKKGDYD